MWSWEEQEYDSLALWGPQGEQHVLWQAALRSHGELPVGCAMLALAAGASNGAMTQLFGDSATPLFFWCLNTNYPQTRKSELTKLLAEGSAVVNALVRAKAGPGD